MIQINDTPKPRDRFGSIPIHEGKPTSNSSHEQFLPRQPKKFFLWTLSGRIVMVLLGLTLLLILTSPLVVPYLTTTLIADQLSSALNRPVTIPRAEFNPLTCTLTAHHLIVGPQLATTNDPVDPLLSAGEISVDFDLATLLDGKVACNLTAQHLFLHLVREKGGGYNLGQVIEILLPVNAVLPWRFSCNTLAISNSRLVFDDKQTGKTHLAEDLTLNISSRRTNSPDRARTFRLQASINGIPVTVYDTATPTKARNQPLVNPAPTVSGENPGDQGIPDDPALKTAEAMSVIHDLAQTAGLYLPNTANLPVELRPRPPLAP